MSPRRTRSVFIAGLVAGILALAFNFLLRLGGLAAFPPEAALGAFLNVVPASIEEPMVQQFGDFAGQLGLILATLVGAVLYGLLAVLFDRVVGRRLTSLSLTIFESLLAFSLIPWLLFGVLLFPLAGVSIFGISSPFGSDSSIWLFPLTLLLTQGLYALLLSPRFAGDMVLAGSMPSTTHIPSGPSRRQFIEKGVVAAFALIAGIFSLTNLGGLISTQIQPSGGSTAIDLQHAPAIFRDPRLQTLVDSEVTPNSNFYRVAVDVIDPTVNLSTWSLKLIGFNGSPKTYLLQDLQKLPQRTQYTTFECVSNEINGALIGNAKWTGFSLSDLFQDAGGVPPGASTIVFHSVEGYTVGIPLSKAMMSDSILAYGMNDQPLPVSHGYPLRAVIPGLYGMMSAKWVEEVAVVGTDYEGFWQTRGWTNNADIHTAVFIVLPVTGGQVSLSNGNGTVMVAGYAFAGDRGISKVEVSFDRGKTWQQATLKNPLSNLTWILWAYEWTPPSNGSYAIYVRATDGSGQVQTSEVTPTFPNGATGYAVIETHVVG